MKEKLLLVVWIFLNIVVFWTNISLAYLDPSAMTYVIQVVAGIVIAASTSIGIIIYKVKRKFSKKKKETMNDNKEKITNEDNENK